MVTPIPFPLKFRMSLVQSIADDLERVHGPQACGYWRTRIAGIASDLRAAGLPEASVRFEIHALQDAVQSELQVRSARVVGFGVA